MSLILTLRRGFDFYSGDDRIVVSKIHSSTQFDLRTELGVTTVTEHDWVEILPGVTVRAGIPAHQGTRIIKVQIEAPGKRLLRGELYRRGLKTDTRSVYDDDNRGNR